MKKRFFSCAWSTFVEQFQQNLKRLGEPYKEAAETVLTYPPQCWVRAYFSNRCLSWRVDNNISESFNAWIDEYRYFPIIRMVDGIRVKMMLGLASACRADVLARNSDLTTSSVLQEKGCNIRKVVMTDPNHESPGCLKVNKSPKEI